MKLYRFSPIADEVGLRAAVRHIHLACHGLCKEALGRYLPLTQSVGVFCHYPEEYTLLKELQARLVMEGEQGKKYQRLREPLVITAGDGVPEGHYTHLYIRQPDPYRSQVGDADFRLSRDDYGALRVRLEGGDVIPGARVFPRGDLDMVELHHPDVDALGYIVPDKAV